MWNKHASFITFLMRNKIYIYSSCPVKNYWINRLGAVLVRHLLTVFGHCINVRWSHISVLQSSWSHMGGGGGLKLPLDTVWLHLSVTSEYRPITYPYWPIMAQQYQITIQHCTCFTLVMFTSSGFRGPILVGSHSPIMIKSSWKNFNHLE